MSARLSNNTLRATVALTCALVIGLVLSACGSGSSHSAQSLIDDTFSARNSIESGQVEVSLALTPAGSSSSAKSASLRLAGPFQNTGAGKLPRFSLKLDLNLAGHAIQAGAAATGSQFFVELAGTWFVAPESTYKTIQQSYVQATRAKVQSTFASLGVEPRRWLIKPVNDGTATVAGTDTYHLSADVNTTAFLQDVSRFAQSGGALGSTVPGVGAISASTITELAKSIHSPRVDVYTGKTDHLLRRLDLSASISSTAQTRSLLGGASSAGLTLHVQLSEVNKPQTIAAPTNPKPFSELLPALQQLLGALQGTAAGASSLGG